MRSSKTMKRKWKDTETVRKAKPEAANADHESESSEEENEGAAKWAQYFDDEDSD